MAKFGTHPSTREAFADVVNGIRVTRSDLATVVWAAGPVSLFTITGGRIMCTYLQQVVTVAAVANDAGTIKFSITTAAPYAVATVDFTAACVSVAQAAIGETVTMVGTALNTAALHQTTIGPTLFAKTASIELTPGIVKCSNTGVVVSGTATCTIVTTMWYLPLEDASRVVAS